MQIDRSHTCPGEEADIVILMLIRNSGPDSDAKIDHKPSIGFIKVRQPVFANTIDSIPSRISIESTWP